MALLTALSKFGACLMVRMRPRRFEEEPAPEDTSPREEVPAWVGLLFDRMALNTDMLRRVLWQQEQIMGTYKDLGDAIARNGDASNSILQMLSEVVQNLKDAQAQNDPAAMDAAIKNLDANTDRLAKAAVKSTPVDTNPGQPLPAAPPETSSTG